MYSIKLSKVRILYKGAVRMYMERANVGRFLVAIILYLQDKKYVLLKEIGSITDEEIMALTRAAKEYGLHCLRGIDFVGDTLLNHKQLIALKRELAFLKGMPIGSKLNITVLDKAVDEVAGHPDLYLMVNGE